MVMCQMDHLAQEQVRGELQDLRTRECQIWNTPVHEMGVVEMEELRDIRAQIGLLEATQPC